MQNEVRFLGHVITKEGLKKTDERIEAISYSPIYLFILFIYLFIPRDVLEVRSFLGMVNYYSKFIKDFANKLQPIHRLLRKNVPFQWTKRCDNAFNEIKRDIMQDVTLAHFDSKLSTVFTCEASQYGLGAILSQIRDGVQRPVAFISRTLTKTEQNYSTLDKEKLAIFYAVKKVISIYERYKVQDSNRS